MKDRGKRVLTLARIGLDKYQSEGILAFLHSSVLYIPRRIKVRIRKRFLGRERPVKFITNLRYRVHQLQYKAPAKPWKLVYVKPNQIEYKVLYPEKRYGSGHIKRGQWDQPENLIPWQESMIWNGLRQRFIEGREWENTAYVKQIKKKFSEGKSYWGYKTLEQYLKIRCRHVDELYHSIKEDGYRPNLEANHTVPEIDSRNSSRNYHHNFEPLVCIGRYGKIYQSDGSHRLIIAQILGIETIPVNVLCRHQEWQHVRDTIARAETSEELREDFRKYLGHPDLTDVIPDSWKI